MRERKRYQSNIKSDIKVHPKIDATSIQISCSKKWYNKKKENISKRFQKGPQQHCPKAEAPLALKVTEPPLPIIAARLSLPQYYHYQSQHKTQWCRPFHYSRMGMATQLCRDGSEIVVLFIVCCCVFCVFVTIGVSHDCDVSTLSGWPIQRGKFGQHKDPYGNPSKVKVDVCMLYATSTR